MSRPPDDRSGELRALFFESAAELLQSLNEAGLELEARPADEEVIRRVRRAVHTLKGDSAACGYYQLSELAHELEDVLSPQVGQARGTKLAEAVLGAADCFSAMLAAYQRNIEPPPADALRILIRTLLAVPAAVTNHTAPKKVAALFAWTEARGLGAAKRYMIVETSRRQVDHHQTGLRIHLEVTCMFP